MIILVVAVSIRLTNLPEWFDHESRSFMHDGRPVLIEFDGYLYLRYARDLVEGSYTSIDTLRNYPAGLPRPSIPPLLSSLIAAIAAVSHTTLDSLGAWIPVAVASLGSLAFYWLGYLISGSAGGVAAALAATTSPFFVTRTQYGHLDTDCGIPPLVVMLVCLAYCGVKCRSAYRYIYWSAYGFTTAILYFWWNTAGNIVLAISFAILCVSVLPCLYRCCLPIQVLGAGGLIIAMTLSLLRNNVLTQYLGQFLEQLTSFGENAPDVIAEQMHFGFLQNVSLGYGHALFFGMVLAGCIVAAWRKPSLMFGASPLFFLGALPFFWYHRFLIFSAPVLAAGTAGLFCLQDFSRQQRCLKVSLTGCCIACFTTGIVMQVRQVTAEVEWPVIPPYTCWALEQARDVTPRNALIWSWWDNGYHIQYFARRATLEDGGNFQFPEINSFPLAITDEKLAANWIHWVAVINPSRARRCVQKLGIETVMSLLRDRSEYHTIPAGEIRYGDCFDALADIHEASDVPVYLFLDHIYLHTAYWWFWYGRKLVDNKPGHGILKPFYSTEINADQLKLADGMDAFDLQRGVLENGKLSVSEAHIKRGTHVAFLDYQFSGPSIFQADLTSDWAALLDSDMFEAVFNRLYFMPGVRRTPFELIVSKTPQFQLWRVHSSLHVAR